MVCVKEYTVWLDVKVAMYEYSVYYIIDQKRAVRKLEGGSVYELKEKNYS